MLLSSCSASATTQNLNNSQLSTKSPTTTPITTTVSTTTTRTLVTFNGFVPTSTYVNDGAVYSDGGYNPNDLFDKSRENALPQGTKVGYYVPGPLPNGYWLEGRNPGELVDNPPMGSNVDANQLGVGAEVVGYVPIIQRNATTRIVADPNTSVNLSIQELQSEPWNSKLKYLFTGIYSGYGTFPDKMVTASNSDATVEISINGAPLVWNYIKMSDSVTVCGYMSGVDVQQGQKGAIITPIINTLYIIDNTNGYRWDSP